MIGILKEYSKELDNLTKNSVDAVRKWLKKKGWDSIDRQDDYGYPDIEAWKEERKNIIFIEVEQRYGWWRYGDSFPFDTIHIPERKGRYLDPLNPAYNKPLWFVVCRQDNKSAVAINIEQIINRKLTWKNKTDELFWDIPITECKHFKMED